MRATSPSLCPVRLCYGWRGATQQFVYIFTWHKPHELSEAKTTRARAARESRAAGAQVAAEAPTALVNRTKRPSLADLPEAPPGLEAEMEADQRADELVPSKSRRRSSSSFLPRLGGLTA